jgi:hypothetical protein
MIFPPKKRFIAKILEMRFNIYLEIKYIGWQMIAQ